MKKDEHLHQLNKTPYEQRPPSDDVPKDVYQLLGSLPIIITVRIPDTAAQTAANFGPMFTAPFPCVLVAVKERHAVAGSDGAAVTLDVEKIPSATAKGSGTTMLNATLSLKATADTVQSGVLTPTLANRELAINDSIGIKTSGTLTALKDVTVTLYLKVLTHKTN